MFPPVLEGSFHSSPLDCDLGYTFPLLSIESVASALGPFSIRSIPARDAASRDPRVNRTGTGSGPPISALQAISLGFWGWGVYLVSSAAQPKSTGSPTILRGRPLFDAHLSRPATSSSFFSCGVNPPPFCCTSTTARRTANYRTSTTSPQLPPAPRLTWDLHQSRRLAAVDSLTNPVTQVRSLINPASALSRAALLHHLHPSRVVQTIRIIDHACSLFSTVLSVDLRHVAALSLLASPCLLVTLLSCDESHDVSCNLSSRTIANMAPTSRPASTWLTHKPLLIMSASNTNATSLSTGDTAATVSSAPTASATSETSTTPTSTPEDTLTSTSADTTPTSIAPETTASTAETAPTTTTTASEPAPTTLTSETTTPEPTTTTPTTAPQPTTLTSVETTPTTSLSPETTSSSTSTSVTPTPTTQTSVSSSVIVSDGTTSTQVITRTIINTPSPTDASSSSETSAGAIQSSESNSSSGIGTGGTIAVAVVVPIAAVAILVALGLWLWRKRKARKEAAEERRKEVEDYTYNPNADPTIPGSGGGAGYEMKEDSSSGYRGWGSTTLGGSTGRKASTTMSGGMVSDTPYSDHPYSDGNSPTRATHPGEPLMQDGHHSPEGEILGAMGPSTANNRGGNVRRGPSNASSSYSAGAPSDGSGEIGQAYGGDQYYAQYDPYTENGAYNSPPGGQPVIRDNPARRNTRIENPSHFPQNQSAGISQNF